MKVKEGVIVHLSPNEPLTNQQGKSIMVNLGNQPLNDGYFFVEHPEHAPAIYRLIDGVRKATGFCLVPHESKGWTIHEKNLKDSAKGMLHII